MHPVLLRTETVTVGSYAFMILAAAVLVVVTVSLRARRGHLDSSLLARTLLLAMVGGWIGGRILPFLFVGQWREIHWNLLLPYQQVGQSASCFLLVALPIVLICLVSQGRRIAVYLDALAPSLLIGLALAKTGCLLAGCCAGRPCPEPWGIRYPYGSDVYTDQWRSRLLDPPAPLVWSDAAGSTRLLGHADYLRTRRDSPPAAFVRHAGNYELSFAELADLAGRQRSLPVWPVPLWYIAASVLAWAAAEIIHRRSRRAGWAAGFVLLAYAAMRLIFDGFVNSPDRSLLGFSQTQLVAVPIGIIGAAILMHLWYRCSGLKTP